MLFSQILKEVAVNSNLGYKSIIVCQEFTRIGKKSDSSVRGVGLSSLLEYHIFEWVSYKSVYPVSKSSMTIRCCY